MKLSQIILSVMSALKIHPSDYCDIETTDGFGALVLKDRSLMTLVRYDGLLSTISPATFSQMIHHIESSLNSIMSKNGYQIGCVFRKDLDAHSTLNKVEVQQKITAKKLNLDIDDLIDENIELYQNTVYDEEVYFALITSPIVLDEIELEMMADLSDKYNYPKMGNAQNLAAPIDVLRAKHTAFVGKALGYKDYKTPASWSYDANLDDLSHILPPSLPRQIMSNGINVYGVKEGLPKNTISVGGRLYSAYVMDIGPNQPLIFNNVFAAFNQISSKDSSNNNRSMPFSICFLISSDGFVGTGLKQMLSVLLARVPKDSNANLHAAFNQLKFLKKLNSPS